MTINKTFLIGNLTADPELRSTPNGVSVCSFRIAVNRRKPDANGDKVTDFFTINTWRNLADTCARFLAKGRKAVVIGELQPRQYQAKDGTTRMSLDVQADEVEFMSAKEDGEKPKPTPKPADPNAFEDISAEDIPF